MLASNNGAVMNKTFPFSSILSDPFRFFPILSNSLRFFQIDFHYRPIPIQLLLIFFFFSNNPQTSIIMFRIQISIPIMAMLFYFVYNSAQQWIIPMIFEIMSRKQRTDMQHERKRMRWKESEKNIYCRLSEAYLVDSFVMVTQHTTLLILPFWKIPDYKKEIVGIDHFFIILTSRIPAAG